MSQGVKPSNSFQIIFDYIRNTHFCVIKSHVLWYIQNIEQGKTLIPKLTDKQKILYWINEKIREDSSMI